MSQAFNFGTNLEGAPADWFELVPISGAKPSALQTALKEAVIVARDRLGANLDDRLPERSAALRSLRDLAKASLVEAEDVAEGSLKRVEEILATAGLHDGATSAPPELVGHRSLSRGAWHVTVDAVSKRLTVTPPDGAVGPPEEQIRLAMDIARVARHLHSVYGESGNDAKVEGGGEVNPIAKAARALGRLKPQGWEIETKVQYFERLANIARIGLGRDYAQVSYARAALLAFETDIFVLRGFTQRRWYLYRCAAYAAAASVLLLVFYGSCDSFFGWIRVGACSDHHQIFLALSGAMLGMWLSIASRRVATTLEELEQVINDPIGIGLRTLYVLNVAFAGCVLLLADVVTIQIGDVSTAKLGWQSGGPMVTLLIGVMLGFSEQTLPTLLARRASEFIQGLGPKA